MAEGFNSALRKLAGLALAAGTVIGLGGTAQAQPFFGFFTRGFSTPATLPPEARSTAVAKRETEEWEAF